MRSISSIITSIALGLTLSTRAQPTSEVEFFDSTGTTSTTKFGWKGTANDGNFYIETPDDGDGFKLQKGDMTIDGAVNAESFNGDGSGLTNLPAAAESDPTVPANVKDGISWGEVSGKPSTYNPATHDHDDDYSDKNHSHSGYATSGHSHSGYSSTSHNHDGDYAPFHQPTFSNWVRIITGADIPGLYSDVRYNTQTNISAGSFTLRNNSSTVTAGAHLAYKDVGGTDWSGYFTEANLLIAKDLHLGGTTVNFSDRNLKRNITTIQEPISKLKKINGVKFNWKENIDSGIEFPREKQVGVIAQDVQEVLPEAVKKNKNGNLMVSYSQLIPLLIEALKEQDKKIEDLNKKIDLLIEGAKSSRN